MCQLICYPVKKLVVHVVEAYVKSSSIAHTTLLLLSLSVWCCSSSRGKSDSSLQFMINSCNSCSKLHQQTFTSVNVPTISSFVSVVEQFISVVAVYARCLGFIWCDVSDCSYMGLEVNFRRTMIPELSFWVGKNVRVM